MDRADDRADAYSLQRSPRLPRPAAPPPTSIPTLSARETIALLAWFAHDSKTAAAESLSIAPSTLSTHIARARAKYAAAGRPAKSKAALLRRAVQDGITDIDHEDHLSDTTPVGPPRRPSPIVPKPTESAQRTRTPNSVSTVSPHPPQSPLRVGGPTRWPPAPTTQREFDDPHPSERAEDSTDAETTLSAQVIKALGLSSSNYHRSTYQLAAWLHLPTGDGTAVGEIFWAEQAGNPLTPASLSHTIGAKSATTNTLITRLENSGYVTRNRENSDRRIVTLRVTTPTLERIAPFLHHSAAAFESALDQYDDDALITVRNVLAHLANVDPAPIDSPLPDDGTHPDT